MLYDSRIDPVPWDIAHASFGAKWLTKHRDTFVTLPAHLRIPEDSIRQQKC